MEMFTYLIWVMIPATIGLQLLCLKRFRQGRIASLVLQVNFAVLLLVGSNAIGKTPIQGWGFRIEELGLLLSLFTVFVSGIVHLFSIRYMEGDRKFHSFFMKLGLLTSSLLLMMGADHLMFMLFFWISSNLLLASLVIHKADWKASFHSGIFMIKLLALGASALALAIALLLQSLGTFSLYEILQHQSLISYPLKSTVLFFLVLAAFIQSGSWPFHKWLLSSPNSPTPVSGLMHAGLVNGGGILLTRFAPLFLEVPAMLHVLFFIGLISVVLGTSGKLIQSNVKGMLACSTMAQMGFMLMQCGLGLFSAAVAHLFWHGLFKCSLFLNSGSAILEKREIDSKKHPIKYLLALCIGLAGSWTFASMIGFSYQSWTPQTILVVFAWFAAAQISYSILHKEWMWSKVLISLISSFGFGILYGGSVSLVKHIVSPLRIDIPMPLQSMHLIGGMLVLLISIGLQLHLFSRIPSRRIYVEVLNFSQSHPQTTTSLRSEYTY